ncbi:MAG: DUF1697 domain-containing protein [Saonia sp.]
MEYIALFRGINVSGQKKIKMADLKTMLEEIGLQNVVTYIQSGNIVFSAEEENSFVLEEKIKNGIQSTFGFDVPVLILTKPNILQVFNDNPFANEKEIENNNIYFVLLKDTPEKKMVEALQKETFKNERFIISKNCIYLACFKGYGNAKCNNNFFEKKLKVSATTRNYKTMQKLVELSNG